MCSASCFYNCKMIQKGTVRASTCIYYRAGNESSDNARDACESDIHYQCRAAQHNDADNDSLGRVGGNDISVADAEQGDIGEVQRGDILMFQRSISKIRVVRL